MTSNVYLRADLLFSGDVFLIRSKGKSSTAIAKFTDGIYSHAALYISGSTIFEADTKGVGFTALPLVKSEVQPDGYVRHLCDVSRYQQLDVYRHPDLAAAYSSGKFTYESLLLHLHALQGYQYSLLNRLAFASDVLRSMPNFKKGVMSVVGFAAGDFKKEVPGMFCSELVTHALMQAGYPPLAVDRLPHFVSPNHLANKKVSKLRPVLGVFSEINDKLSENDVLKKSYDTLSFAREMSNDPANQGVRVEKFVDKCVADMHAAVADAKVKSSKVELIRSVKDLRNYLGVTGPGKSAHLDSDDLPPFRTLTPPPQHIQPDSTLEELAVRPQATPQHETKSLPGFRIRPRR